jgi:hypothetical protein
MSDVLTVRNEQRSMADICRLLRVVLSLLERYNARMTRAEAARHRAE